MKHFNYLSQASLNLLSTYLSAKNKVVICFKVSQRICSYPYKNTVELGFSLQEVGLTLEQIWGKRA